ncbi:MAG: pseudouridine synthase [Gammaproteobacteria bacterium]|jgi:23S rRNA pseudouridine2605 synthase
MPHYRSRVTLSERVHKWLASTGAGSRREIERWINDGRLRIDSRIAQIGDRVTGNERFWLDGHEITPIAPERSSFEYLLYYKPAGEITTRSDPEGRRTVFDSVAAPTAGRWINVGRLDASTSGLLLLTTDGELAHRLMHPGYAIPRAYSVRVHGRLSENHIAALRRGVELEDGTARVSAVRPGGASGANAWYEVTLSEGRNREVRRVFQALGFEVNRLIRTRYGPLQLTRLRRGESRPLTRGEIEALYSSVNLPLPGERV